MQSVFKIKFFCVFCAFCVTLASCEKPIIPEESDEVTKGNLTVSIYQLEQTPFENLTRSVASDVCTRLNFAVYSGGTRVKQVNQEISNANFGTASFQLSEGIYQLVVVAHSSSGNPTMTNPAKIQFTNALGFTDTFLYNGEVVLEEDDAQQLNISLERIVSLCRFVMTDDYPAGVTKMRFQYKGGSGAFDASTGFGSVNSTQTIWYNDVSTGQKQFDLYTFLHDTEGTIHLLVTAYDDYNNVLYEREFDVPLVQNHVTWLTGPYFSGSGAESMTMTVTINTDWEGEYRLTF